MFVTPPDNSIPVSPGQTSLTDQNQNQNQTLVCFTQNHHESQWLQFTSGLKLSAAAAQKNTSDPTNTHRVTTRHCHTDPSARRCRLHESIQAESDQRVRHRALKRVRLHKHRISFSLSWERRLSSPAERRLHTQQLKVQLHSTLVYRNKSVFQKQTKKKPSWAGSLPLTGGGDWGVDQVWAESAAGSVINLYILIPV